MSNYQYYEYQSDDNNGYANPYGSGGGYTPYGQPQKPKKDHKFIKKLGKVAAIALVFGLVAGVVFQGASHLTAKALGDDKQIAAVKEEETGGGAKQLTTSDQIGSTAVSTATTVTDVSDIAENVMPAIVQVTNMSITEYRSWFGQSFEQKNKSAGSGIIMSSDDDYLYIASNNHVVEGAQTLTITFVDGAAVEAEIQGTNPEKDLAVIRVSMDDIEQDTKDAIKIATIGDSAGLKVGESSVVIGNAMGYGQSVTTGVISALNRDVTFRNNDGSTYTNSLIQTEAAVNPGNSGGALLNMNGEVIGIVSAKYADTVVEGMGYAIPISDARPIIEGFINQKNGADEKTDDKDIKLSEAYLGIAGVDIDEMTAYQYNMPTGVYVARVESGTGAEAAGLQKGDVITGFDGTDLYTMAEIQKALMNHKVGDKVKVKVARQSDNYAISEVEVTLSKRPAETN
ncbi:MAG: trypsin-like peptidase domain-containing protein [Lachnospiraceae bacterium]|nr:trypsin-like peptidase domain-containing protein [Lachnospiraceae bacterium]